MEVLGFNFKNIIEETKLKLLLNSISIAHTNMEIATHVIDFRKKKKIKIPDAIILATAKHLNADVLTENRKDFKGLGWDDKIVSPSGLQ